MKLSNPYERQSELEYFNKTKKQLMYRGILTRKAIQDIEEFQGRATAAASLNYAGSRLKNKQGAKKYKEKIHKSFQNFSGQQHKGTPYRSLGRINKLMKQNNYTQDDIYKNNKKQKYYNNNYSQDYKKLSCQDTKSISSETTANSLLNSSDSNKVIAVGNKRAHPNNTRQLEYEILDLVSFGGDDEQFMEVVEPMGNLSQSTQDVVVERRKHWKISLINKLTGRMKNFKCYNEQSLNFLTAKLETGGQIADFSMDNLEKEYDYDTDEEQIYRAKKHLLKESIMAIEFCVKDEPLMLIDNLTN